LDALDTVTLITLEADKTKVDECRDILRTLASSATDAEASIAARSYYNIATLLCVSAVLPELRWLVCAFRSSISIFPLIG
jgi:hypothetical protein